MESFKCSQTLKYNSVELFKYHVELGCQDIQIKLLVTLKIYRCRDFSKCTCVQVDTECPARISDGSLFKKNGTGLLNILT